MWGLELQLGERWDFGKKTFLSFTSLEKVCGHINRQEIWKALHKENLSKGLIECKEHL
jgi:hypothetical protein